MDVRKAAVFGEDVARLTDRADDVAELEVGGRLSEVVRHRVRGDGPDAVEGVVHGRADEVVHGGVLDDEPLAALPFDVDHAAHKQAGVADDRASRLQRQPAPRFHHRRDDNVGVVADGGRLAGAVIEAEAAAEVDPVGVVALVPQVADQRDGLGGRLAVRVDRVNRGAEVHVNAGQRERRHRQNLAGQFDAPFDVDAELVALLARCGLRVRLRVDVGVQTQGDAGHAVHRLGDGRDGVEFGLRLDVEHQDVGFEGRANFGVGLADAGEDHAARLLPRLLDAVQLAAGNDVKAAPLLAQQAEDRQVGVGFDAVADRR